MIPLIFTLINKFKNLIKNILYKIKIIDQIELPNEFLSYEERLKIAQYRIDKLDLKNNKLNSQNKNFNENKKKINKIKNLRNKDYDSIAKDWLS